MREEGIYVGEVIIDRAIEAKIKGKHNVTPAEVRQALQRPAQTKAAFEEHPVHGARWVAVGQTEDGRQLIAAIIPTPSYLGAQAESWVLKTARWVRNS